MLKNIPEVISPYLMKVLMEMGHGDELVLADGNFPAASIAQGTPGGLIRADGNCVPELLKAILMFFPLDTFVERSVTLMAVVGGAKTKPSIWHAFNQIINESGEKFSDFNVVRREAFYSRAKDAYAVVATGEKALYANVILKKGVVTSSSDK